MGVLLVLLAVAGMALRPAPVSGQQDTTRTAAADTLAGDTVAADTLPADTVLTPRERALRRLRSMSVTPVQGDTTVADSATADTLRADGLARDSVAGDSVAGDSLPAIPPELREPGQRPGVGPDTLVFQGRPREQEPPGDGLVVADSVLAVLRTLDGYSRTEYAGESAIFRTEDDRLELTGRSRVGQGESALETDSLLVYDGGTGIVCGYGAPVLSGSQDPIESRELCFNIEANLGMAVGARTRFQQGATWYVRGGDNRVYLLTGGEHNTLYGERAEFTSCDLDHPHYTFEARSLKMVEDEMMVARDITLQFEDVPVFWLPWMVQSMKRDRRSGLLMPQFGVNDIVRNGSGYNRHLSNLGFYWAINDYVSAKGTFEWYSGNWTAVEGALTYRWLRQFLQGSVITKQYWRQREGVQGSREFTINTSNGWQPDERTRVSLNANYATSTQFVRDNSFDPRELNRKITSSASVNRSFDWGSMSVGADRSEQLSTGQVDMKLPGVSLNISPITLFRNDDGLSLSWNGSGNATRRTRDVADTLSTPDSETLDAGFSHGLSLGRLGLSQRVSWREETLVGESDPLATPEVSVGGVDRALTNLGGRPFDLSEATSAQLGWSTSLRYQQALWSGTTLSPSVSINGNRVRDERTDGVFVDEPNRVSAGASLNTSIYGFWPGFGRFSRIRHKISPTVQWSYSPEPRSTALQEEVFGRRNLREQNRLTLSFNQTFEAKVREDEDGAPADSAEGGAGAGADPAAALAGPGLGAVGGGARGEPRRLPSAEKVMLLALDTRTSFVYDFVAAEEDGRGFLTDRIQNSIRSDLLRGLQLTATHELFEEGTSPGGDALAPRRLDPFLTNLSASFSIDDDFWLFEFLGLTGEARDPAGPGQASGREPERGVEGVGGSRDPNVGAEASPDRSPGGPGSVMPGRGSLGGGPAPGVGGWRASLSYSLVRSRPGTVGASENQQLNGNFSFQPTRHWSLRWSTGYSFTDSQFTDHVLTLSRDLHRWTANFDFVKAQNGNFTFSFRVQLRDNPDLKLDYDQRTNAAGQASRNRLPEARR